MTMSEPRHRLRVLHISDLHERGPHETEHWRRRRVLGDAWDRNLAELLQDGPVDLVCFTGDAANWGLEAEYEAVGEFFEALLTRLGVPSERLFVIPGNHDINRGPSASVWKELRDRASRVDRLEFARWMAEGPTPLGLEEGWRDEILVRQAAYRRWVNEGIRRPELDPKYSPHRRLGYRATVQIPGAGFPIHVIGLDTAWLCGDRNESGQLRLTDHQLMSLASDSKGKPLPGLRLVLMHHPFQDLADGAHCRKLLAGQADLVLRGHLHEQTVETWADPDRTVRQIAAGCLYEGDRADHWPNACQLVTLHLDDAGGLGRVDLRFRAFSPSGHWYDDDSLYQESRGGRLSWFINSSLRTLINPYDAWTPATPPRFIGRRVLLRKLGNALDEGRSVSLVGDWRTGKSSLLQTWAKQQGGRGREVRLLDGEKVEAVSPSAFVEKITGQRTGSGADEAAEVLESWAKTVGRPGLPPLILVDEFDGMVPRFEPRFLERLRGMLGAIVLVLGSRRGLDLLHEELNRTSPFQNRLELYWLGLLDPIEADELISLGNGLLTPSDIDLMRRWAGRHPFYLQLLGRHLADARRYDETIGFCLDRFRAEANARLRELWRVLEDRDRDALRRTLLGQPAQRAELRWRGLVTEDGWPFGEILAEWLREEA